MSIIISKIFLIKGSHNINFVKSTKAFAEMSSVNLSNKINLKKPNIKADNLEVNKTEINLFKGETEYIYFKVFPSNASNKSVKWKSSDSSVAKITESGQVIAQKVGKCQVFCILKEDNKIMKK